MSRQRKRLEPTSIDLAFLYLGIIMAATFIIAYSLVLTFNYNKIMDSVVPKLDGPEALGLLIFVIFYVIILFVIFMIPIFYFVVNIVLTAITISSRRVFLARVLSIYGFLGLTVFNAIASINMLKRFNKQREEEKAQSND